MNVLDSSCWLEYLKNTRYAEKFAPLAEKPTTLLVPSLCLYEVGKKILEQAGEDAALEVTLLMQQGKVIPLDADIALYAAELSVDYRLPMAESVILATAWQHKATLWTMDSDFREIDGVRYIAKK